MFQTEQTSDKIDDEFGILDDIFLDGVDIHEKYGKANIYGPVLFVMKPELFLSVDKPLKITTFNPLYWRNFPTWRSRYLMGTSEFKLRYDDWQNQSASMMFTLNGCDKGIRLADFLEEIVVDVSGFTINEMSMGNYLKTEIEKTLSANGLEQIPVHIRRHTRQRCACVANYEYLKESDKPELIKRLRSKERFLK